MWTVWKIVLGVGKTMHALPEGVQFLNVGLQYSTTVLWILLDKNKPFIRDYVFEVVYTGDEAPSPNRGAYLGTNMKNDGQIVEHVFYIRPNESSSDLNIGLVI